MLYKVVPTFECVDKILKLGHSNKSCWALRSCGEVCFLIGSGAKSVYYSFLWCLDIWVFRKQMGWLIPDILTYFRLT